MLYELAPAPDVDVCPKAIDGSVTGAIGKKEAESDEVASSKLRCWRS